MSNRFERDQKRAGEDRSSTNMMRLLGQMLMLPFTVFVYGMEVFVRTVQGMQRVADQGMDVMAGGAAQPHPDGPASEGRPAGQIEGGGGAPTPGTQQGGWGDLKIQTKTSTGDGTVEDTAEANQKEIVKMADKNLSDDQLKLVRYKILFVKRDYEVAFDEREELVHDNITGEAFTAWKVAEFIQRLNKEKVPDKWKKKDYPRKFSNEEREPDAKVYINRLDEDDKKYLRVFYEVLDRYVREDEEDDATLLKDIRKAIDRLPRIEHGKGVYTLTETERDREEREAREREEREARAGQPYQPGEGR